MWKKVGRGTGYSWLFALDSANCVLRSGVANRPQKKTCSQGSSASRAGWARRVRQGLFYLAGAGDLTLGGGAQQPPSVSSAAVSQPHTDIDTQTQTHTTATTNTKDNGFGAQQKKHIPIKAQAKLTFLLPPHGPETHSHCAQQPAPHRNVTKHFV